MLQHKLIKPTLYRYHHHLLSFFFLQRREANHLLTARGKTACLKVTTTLDSN